MDNTTKEAIERLNPINEDLKAFFKKHGVVTGSFKFGGFVKGKSDIDIIIPYFLKEDGFFQDLIDNKQGFYIPHEYSKEEFRCIYVKTKDGTILNLLLPHTKEYYNIMVRATKITIGITKYFESIGIKHPFEQRETRLRVFEYCKDICKELICE